MSHKFFYLLIVSILLLIYSEPVICSYDFCSLPERTDSSSKTEESIKISYGSKGVEFSADDGNYKLQIQSRLQFRYSYPFDTDPVTFSDFQEEQTQTYKINRARLKVGGNVFKPWLKFYWEYDFPGSNLLDFRLMLERFEFIKLKVGQWKIHYNRERIISSGKQQTVERSILTRAFTIDRQQGVSLYGRLKGKSVADFNYWFSVLTGTGRGSRSNDDKHLMFMSRLQWNCFGRVLSFTSSDTKYHEKPTGLIAIAGVTNRSPYTRFSTGGSGQLEGFDDGEPGQYRVNQFLVETAFMFKGFSWQQEFHLKEIDDKVNNQITTLIGNYVQVGYFFHYLWSIIPKPLEAAFRYANYNPDRSFSNDNRREYSFNINWFFKDHLNKLTTEISYLDLQRSFSEVVSGWRFRLQWDVSI
ncbi:MAG: OprO/OprP family phosphate-selective porin [Ignavibacteria bacterium]|nr:OprO/OprP family phosphate-selective porin [Ignavibacteria bacterium]MBT8382818.1 OprO/OprP family phosphate-selective porin [Ignavibacteria bacterium]MBT8390962.1 OprO/OprP family phosphate-selective porin [Ignavibacteria bacterium]NNJ52708.1 porin [Ignavibacteriaceae bacterium]NNL21565.1 porin [Ignavibacteriaceae bacterium]